ncbi:amphiphysin isoform 2-T7 [Glossina fuscipes fuscipes]
MAENKGIMLAKSVQKHAGRAKEKLLQNLGKVDRTADEIFDDHLNNFNRQQQNANRLQKEFNNYIRCIRAAQAASKSLMEAVCEIYEPQWTGYDALQAQVSASESLWQDFSHKLADQVLIPLNTYTGQFPEMKKKVDKRNRKLIDYDGQRHSFQNLQANANKRKDDVKLTKGREQLEEARRTYELMNTELHDELPALYDSRILFLVTNLQTLFATEQVFHNETSKIFSELEAIVDKLATESQRGSNTLRKQTSNVLKGTTGPIQTPVKQLNNANITNSNQYQNQITANGTSNNPPSPSSSALGQRLDHEGSPTPPPPDTTQPIAGEIAVAKADSSSPVIHSRTSTPSTKMLATDTVLGNSVIENDVGDNNATTNDPEKLLSQNVISSSTTIGTIAISKEASKDADIVAASVSASPTINHAAPINELSATIALKEKSPSNGTKLHKVKNDLNLSNVNSTMATTTITTLATITATTSKVSTGTSNTVSVGTTASLSSISSFELNLNGNSNKQTTNGENCLVTTTNSNNNMTSTATATATTTTTTTTITNNNTTTNGNKDTDANAITTTSTTIDDSNKQQQQLDATLTDLPPGVLYRVKATYGYVKEDVDELSFEVGDIIRVIEYDDPEDQEEGWLMGQKEGTEEKGLFPANFTRPI